MILFVGYIVTFLMTGSLVWLMNHFKVKNISLDFSWITLVLELSHPFSGCGLGHEMHLENYSKPEKVRWESQWGTEWMCWCLEVNIQYPTLRVLHVWISLSEQGQGRYRTGQEGVEPKTGNRKIERDIKGCETWVREVVRNLRNLSHLSFFRSLLFLCFISHRP